MSCFLCLDFDSKEESLDHPDWYWFRLMVLIVYFSMAIFGIPMLMAILSYEKNGGDPQKRTIMNRLLMNLVYNCLLAYMTSIKTIQLRLIFGPLPEVIVHVMFIFANAWHGTASLLAITAMTIIRFLSLFVWKRVPPLNDNFFSQYFISLNYLVSFVLAFGGRFGKIESSEMFYILAGKHLITNSQEPKFRQVCFF